MPEIKTVNKTVANTTGAESIFRESTSLATETLECKIVFIAPSKHGMRLVVARDGKPNACVYVFPEIVNVSGARAGNKVSMLVEKSLSKKNGIEYWNCTALAVLE